MYRPSPQVQRRASVVVSVISLAAVAWWVSNQDAPKFPDSLGGYLWLVAALAVYAIALTARGWRWHRIMRLAEIPHRRADAYRLTLVGYMGNNVLPARGGEVLRIAILGSRSTAKRRTILGSILAERILDAAVLAALFAVMTWFGVAGAPVGQWPASLAAVALVVGGVALAGYLALRRRGRFERFNEKVRPVTRALKIFAHAEGLLLASLSALIWSCEGITLLFVGHSIGLELHFFDSILIIVLASLLAAIPAAPGYAGTFDAGLILGLKAVGVTGGTAVGFVVLARFVMFVPVTLAGLFVLLHSYRDFRLGRRGGSEVLGNAGRLAVEEPPAQRERAGHDPGGDEQSLGTPDRLPDGRRAGVDHRVAHLGEDGGERRRDVGVLEALRDHRGDVQDR
jgi:glycosyltransferase 2 family protein